MNSTVHVKRIINAPIARVFKAWTDPEELAQWHSPAGVGISKAVSQNQVGGERHVTMTMGDDSFPMDGKYIEFDEPNKLVYSWTDPNSIVTVLFTAIDEGKTEIELTQTNAGEGDDALNGWNQIFDRLPGFLGE